MSQQTHKEKEEERSARDFPIIVDLAKTFINVALKVDPVIQGNLDEDHLGFFLLLHYRKQLQHINSVVELVPSRDAVLLARSMLEGASQLFFLRQNGDDKKIQEEAHRFKQFAAIHDWREMKKFEEAGDPLKPELQDQIEKNLAEVGSLFYKKEARKAIQKGETLPPDPYHRDWHGKGATELIKAFEMGGQHGDIFTQFYGGFSGYHHWSTAGLAAGVTWKENRLRVNMISHQDSVISLMTGIGCLLYTCDSVLLHFEKEMPGKIKPEIIRFRNHMNAELTKINFGKKTE